MHRRAGNTVIDARLVQAFVVGVGVIVVLMISDPQSWPLNLLTGLLVGLISYPVSKWLGRRGLLP